MVVDNIQKKENPSSLRSKQFLVDALLKLMEGKPYEKISIKEITEKALLSRRTFYTNFETKNDILHYYTETLLEEYSQRLRTYPSLTQEEIIREYFAYWKTKGTFLRLLSKNGLMIFVKSFEQYLISFFETNTVCPSDYVEDDYKRYRAILIAGGLWNLLVHWGENDFDKSPEKMAAIFNRTFETTN